MKKLKQIQQKQSEGLPKFRTQYNAHLYPKQYEKNNGISMTVPGQGYSLKDILEKFTNGMALDVQHLGQYAENPDFDNIDPTLSPDFDLSDMSEIQSEQQARAEQHRNKPKPGSTAPLTTGRQIQGDAGAVNLEDEVRGAVNSPD
ncbi:MAG: hypothetical protein [Microviridae sp.]|nr:MAG: hypothetical protein [Microviridae sp.]